MQINLTFSEPLYVEIIFNRPYKSIKLELHYNNSK